MKRIICSAVLAGLLAPATFADTLTGFNTVTVDNSDGANIILADLTYGGMTYTAGQFLYGTTTRYYNSTNGGSLLWPEGDPVPLDIASVPGTSNAKSGDVGSRADNNMFNVGGANDISSLDALPYQMTVFLVPVDKIFVFERGANDQGTVQPILLDDSLGSPLDLTTATYASLGSYTGQNVGGYLYLADSPIKGIQINASGHDSLAILSVIPEPTSLSLLGLGMVGVFLMRRRGK